MLISGPEDEAQPATNKPSTIRLPINNPILKVLFSYLMPPKEERLVWTTGKSVGESLKQMFQVFSNIFSGFTEGENKFQVPILVND